MVPDNSYLETAVECAQQVDQLISAPNNNSNNYFRYNAKNINNQSLTKMRLILALFASLQLMIAFNAATDAQDFASQGLRVLNRIYDEVCSDGAYRK